MSARANYFKIGIFVISAAVIAIIAIVALGVGTFFQKKIMMETYIDGSVQGLDVGSPVKFRGVKFGDVEEIIFVHQEYKLDPTSEEFIKYGQYVLVKVGIEPGRDITEEERRQFVEKMIERGLRVRLASQGITGVAYLEVDYLDPEKYPPLEITWEPKTYYIPSVPSTITQFTESMEKILEKIEQINIEGITSGVEETLKDMTKTIKDLKVKEITELIEVLLTEVRETNKKVGPLISNASETMDSVSEELPEILGQLKRTLRRFNNIVSGEEENIEVSTENLRLITGNLRELTENARRYPSQLMFGEPPPHSKPGGRQ